MKLGKHKKWQRFFRNSSGAVTMEYVLLCVMISAAAMMMVITFSRAVTRQFALMSYVMAPLPDEDFSEIQQRFRDDTKDDAKTAGEYSDLMHGEKEKQK